MRVRGLVAGRRLVVGARRRSICGIAASSARASSLNLSQVSPCLTPPGRSAEERPSAPTFRTSPPVSIQSCRAAFSSRAALIPRIRTGMPHGSVSECVAKTSGTISNCPAAVAIAQSGGIGPSGSATRNSDATVSRETDSGLATIYSAPRSALRETGRRGSPARRVRAFGGQPSPADSKPSRLRGLGVLRLSCGLQRSDRPGRQRPASEHQDAMRHHQR